MSPQDVVRQDWFQNVLRKDNYDAILVMAHMGTKDPSIQVLLSAIWNVTGSSMPVQFITGHTHVRRFNILDDWSTVLEARCYLDTIGIASFPTKQIVLSMERSKVSDLFHHDFLDATVKELKSRLGVNTLKTTKGQELTDLIHKTQQVWDWANWLGALLDDITWTEHCTMRTRCLACGRVTSFRVSLSAMTRSD